LLALGVDAKAIQNEVPLIGVLLKKEQDLGCSPRFSIRSAR